MTEDIENNEISVCGVNVEGFVSADSSSITVVVPALVTEHTQSTYSLRQPEVLSGSPISDSGSPAKAFDDDLSTVFLSSSTTECFLGVDFGEGQKADIRKIRYSPNSAWSSPSTILEGGSLEYSDDCSTWSQLFELDPA